MAKRPTRTYQSSSLAEIESMLADHEARLRQLEQYASRIMGALLFIAAEIPVVLAIVLAVWQRLSQ